MSERFNGGRGAATCDGCFIIVRYGTEARAREVRPYVTLALPGEHPLHPGHPLPPLHFCAEDGIGKIECLHRRLNQREPFLRDLDEHVATHLARKDADERTAVLAELERARAAGRARLVGLLYGRLDERTAAIPGVRSALCRVFGLRQARR